MAKVRTAYWRIPVLTYRRFKGRKKGKKVERTDKVVEIRITEYKKK